MDKYVKEYFGFFDIWVMWLLFLTGLTGTFFHFSGSVVLVLLAGMLAYALSEYSIHRFIFHMKPPVKPFFLKLLKRLHYDHHEIPDQLHLLFLPLWFSLPLFVLTGGIVYLLLGDIWLTVAMVTGSMAFHLYYEWVHYVAHRPIIPRTRWGKWMKKYHLRHHFKNEHYWYGVTNPTTDWFFGTYKKEKEVPMSRTARKLDRPVEDMGS
ncbi:fatty acid hydroxylase [Marinithermofilum abyssi]|uniref:Fatty acid hydroxylase n=1 Tax=Marinithermofilum abyssi TaxID=1571185 RepID=A0A8J2VBU8_9BACL|nr:sterol desaturase family protein [Marinithermofilum abyssi]GGE13785.1 fatty acid hydroxylase [Marinithermofilum abyssi]